MFVRAYPRETQEMVFDAHDRAFAFFKGACTRGIYDNMKTAVETIFVGRDRAYNRRFQQMCSHYLVEPVACNPASGWDKGQVENQVGLVRERFFTPRLRVKSHEELTPGLWSSASTMLAGIVIRSFEIGQFGRSSRQNARAWFGMPIALTGSTRFPHLSPRPASCGSTATNTQQQILGGCERNRASCRDPRLCRSDRTASGWPPGRRAPARVR